ncbi:hypothetical protein [Kibdelosporangium philippinense]|uniref:hypothetical protein n=1 Tax=Kibdelosporangium philippinense TaxID=211113 RepID=UPI00362229FC
MVDTRRLAGSARCPDMLGPLFSSWLGWMVFRVSAPPARRVKLLDSLSAWLLAAVRRSRVQHAMPERQTRAGTRR